MTASVVAPDSPIRVKPSALDTRQRIFLDGIQIAIDSLQVAYERLVKLLLDDRDLAGTEHYVHYAASTSDAWTMVDSAHRLLILVDQMPGLSNRAPAVRLLHQDLDHGEDIRNALQHLPGHVQDLGPGGGQAYGRLSWIDLTHAQGRGIRMGSMLPSAQVPLGGEIRWELPNPAGKVLTLPIDLVTLTVGAAALDLSSASRGVRRFTGRLELALWGAFDDHKIDLQRADKETRGSGSSRRSRELQPTEISG